MSSPTLVSRALAALVATAWCTAATAQVGNPQTGRQKAQPCGVCHGPTGVSVAPDAPNLAGQPALYVAAQLKGYRDGLRKHEVMAVMARPLSDEDIAHLAAWYAAIRIEATAP